LTAAMTGSGRHALEVRLFNSSSSASTQSVDLSTTGKGAATWTFSLQDQNKPWVAVVVPDGRYDERVEAFGASSSAPRMPTA
jgi:hypothetical protein